jgi:hypothetical protein
MKFNDKPIDASIARNAAIVSREKRRIRTVDARSRDTLLSAVVTPQNPAMCGKTWIGDIRSRFESTYSTADTRTAVKSMIDALKQYDDELGPDLNGSTTDDRPEQEFSLDEAGPVTMAWDAHLKRTPTKDLVMPRGQCPSPAQINAMNREFYKG